MRLTFYLLIALILFNLHVFGQTGGQPQPTQQQTTATNPRNAPSTTGFIQQAITDNAATLALLGINPYTAQTLATQSAPVPTETIPTTTGTVPVTTTVPAVVPPDTVVNVYIDTFKLPKSDLFGYDFFRNKTIQVYSRSADAPPSGNYVIDEGDQLSINIWGYSSFSGSFLVDQTGSIYPSGTGKIYIKGLMLSQAKELIRSRFASYLDMSNSQIEVTIIYSRNINVNIVGEVFLPGTFNIPASNTVFNALIAAQGPTDKGSLRKIYVKRAGETVRTLDVYQFLLNPQSNQDYYLQDNDYIFVPPIGKVVAIAGEVNRPYKYELIEGEDLNSLIGYSGGLTAYAYTKAIQIRRYENQRLVLIDVNLDSLMKVKGKYDLVNGDEVFISTVPDQLIQFIKVSGAVMAPGNFSYVSGMRISDVIRKAGLRNDALKTHGYIIRKNEDLTSSYIPFVPQNIIDNPSSIDNLTLNNADEVYFYSKVDFVDALKVNINGAIRLPGEYVYAEGMTLGDLLLTAGGIKPDAANTRIEISRYQVSASGIPTPQVAQSFAIGADLSVAPGDQSFLLEPFDIVFVRSLGNYSSQDEVTINGQVLYPGNYSMNDKVEKLTDVIGQAGGVTQWADVKRATLIRVENDRGYVIMNLEEAMRDPGGKFDFILRPGDIIDIPLLTDIVTVSGMINYPYQDSLGFLNVPFHEGRRAKFYIKHYGLGFQKEAKRGRTYVIQPGNYVQDARHWGFIQKYPKVENGAYVVVPIIPSEVEPKSELPPVPVDYNVIIESAMIKITGLLTLALLLSRVGTF